MTTTQTDSGHGALSATVQDSTTPLELPGEQEETHQEDYPHKENEVLTFDFGTASPDDEEALSK